MPSGDERIFPALVEEEVEPVEMTNTPLPKAAPCVGWNTPIVPVCQLTPSSDSAVKPSEPAISRRPFPDTIEMMLFSLRLGHGVQVRPSGDVSRVPRRPPMTKFPSK